MNDLVDVIDLENNVIATKKRCDVTKGDMLRYVHVYLFDSNNNMIIQQRAEGRVRANLIDPSAAGHVDSGESFETVAYRELKEELGVATELEFICDSWGDYGLCKVYKGFYEGVLNPAAREVKLTDKIPFFDLVKLHHTRPYIFITGFVDSFSKYLETIYSLFDQVDEKDQVIGQCSYEDMVKHKLSVRVVHVLIRNNKGELLFQQRSQNVAMPLQFDDAATGHVDAGESYEQGANRELYEELGIKVNFKTLKPFYYKKLPHNNKFAKAYIVEHEGPFNAEPDEVANLVWLNLDEIEMMMNKMPYLFTNSCLLIHKKYKETLEVAV
ncbi:MAG: isopentenyl-diphosphate delta-isomerase [Alphaproteobacteria bacterium]|jgi:isopentenyl-diphosphate delta-isomerase